MASPVPLLKAPTPGGRSQSGSRTPKLTLGIPPSPNVKPVTGEGQGQPMNEIPRMNLGAHNNAPKLSLATPMNSQEGKPQVQPLNITSIQEQNDRSRSDSFHNASVPGSASSSTWSQLSLAMGGSYGQKTGTPDPSSAITDRSVYSEAGIGGTQMEREGSQGGLSIDFEKLSLEKGRPLDIEDLDDEGWAAASEQKRIDELGSLGEGAGGAVTRCKLKDGQMVFALKVNESIAFRNHY